MDRAVVGAETPIVGERTRSFLAILLPEEMIEAAANLQDELRGDPRFVGVRWVAAENFHLTVRFFGDLDRDALEKASGVVESIDGRFAPLRVRIGSVSAFPTPARPQVIWIAVENPDGTLDHLVSEVDLHLRRSGFGAADKPWRSHLTLGRVGRGKKLRVEQDWPRGLTAGQGEFTIEKIALMESELRPEGPRYTALRTAFAGS